MTARRDTPPGGAPHDEAESPDERTERQRRDSFRLEYPLAERPRFETGGHRLQVIEVSEGGMTMLVPAVVAAEYESGATVEGVLRFRQAPDTSVEGVVRRTSPGRAAVQFTRGVPWACLLEEQRRLLARYPQRL